MNEYDDFVLSLDDEVEALELEIDDSQELDIEIYEPLYVVDRNYNRLYNKPRINGVELIGDKTPRQLGIPTFEPMSNELIEGILQTVFFPDN